ncbi:polysaccharide deacetylase family protein [Candidatus Saccharibacteria bacterium]|nr:polysaccharide deacetylase family protein [Candidatus Saccharibacteria bacterium]
MSTRDRSLLRRIDIQFPWLKLVVVIFIGIVAILDLLDLTISKIAEPGVRLKMAPMSRHVEIVKRDLYGKKLVALTFDDGPSNATTPRLINVLKSKDAVATFFMLGSMARQNPDLVKQVEKEGNEVASHTMYHQNLPRISADSAIGDINEAKSILNDILGHPVKYTRPPYGNVNNVVLDNTGTPLILWSVDTLDWKNRNPAEILEITKNQVSEGGIILMHDIYDTTVDAVGSIIDELRKEGYEFATISELAKERGIKLENKTVYYSL